jgi:putative transposase
MQFRGYTYALRPTAEQAVLFEQFAGICRLVWNLALDQRLNHWRNFQATTGDNLNYVAQARELTKLRAEVDFVRAVPQQSQQRTLKALDEAFRRAWQGKSGYPKFKRKGVSDAFSFNGREIRVKKVNRRWSRVRLPKIGWVKFRDTRPIRGNIVEVAVTRTALEWQVSIGCKLAEDGPAIPGAVGIDRGITVPMMLSDGTSYALPAGVDVLDKRIRKAQRVASRRKRGSARHAKANRRVAKLRARQARIRKHWAHTTTTDICRRHGTVVVERLRTQNMTASVAGTIAAPGRNVSQKRGLNRAILNVGWHQIDIMLAYKAGSLIKVNPAYSSQTCGSCGATDSRSRKNQASFVCTSCGHRDNADRNAAVVILNRGNTPGVEPCQWAGNEARTIHGKLLGNPRPLG